MSKDSRAVGDAETYLFAESEMLVCVYLVGVLLRRVRSLAPHNRTAARQHVAVVKTPSWSSKQRPSESALK